MMKNSANHSDIIRAISEKYMLDEDTVITVIRAYIEEIIEALGRKESVLIKKRHEKKTKRKKQVYKRIKMMIVIIIEKTLFFICNFSNIKSIKGFNKIADK